MAPLNVEVYNDKHNRLMFETKVGSYGKPYQLGFVNLMALIRRRCGYEQKKLEYRR